MARQQSRPGWWQGPDGRWYATPPYERPPTNPRRENNEHSRSFLGLLKAAPLIVKILLAIFGGGTTITVVIVIGVAISPSNPSQPYYSYPAAIRQGWLNDCESRSFNSPSICECELSYFDHHVTARQFEQDYGEMPPGVVPAQLAGAEACSS
jgi:hypothetical protein